MNRPGVAIPDEDLPRIVLIAVIGLQVLNACDLLLTRHLLTNGGHEQNGLLAGIISGPYGAAVKIVVPMLLALRYLTAPTIRRTTYGLLAVSVIYLSVVTWNLHLVQVVYG